MKSQHWENFVPVSSKVSGWHGGIHPEYKWDKMNSGPGKGFCGITYRLQVAEAENGYHHFMAMFTSIQGVAWSNACIKEACRPGTYQFLLHFNFLTPANANPGLNFIGNSYRASMFMGQDSGGPDALVYGTGEYSCDVMVFRPSLVNPANANSRVDLWTPQNGIFQMFFTGFPLLDPNRMDGADYEL